MDHLPTAMMGFGLGLLTASLATAVIVGADSTTVLAQDPPAGLVSLQPLTEAEGGARRG